MNLRSRDKNNVNLGFTANNRDARAKAFAKPMAASGTRPINNKLKGRESSSTGSGSINKQQQPHQQQQYQQPHQQQQQYQNATMTLNQSFDGDHTASAKVRPMIRNLKQGVSMPPSSSTTPLQGQLSTPDIEEMQAKVLMWREKQEQLKRARQNYDAQPAVETGSFRSPSQPTSTMKFQKMQRTMSDNYQDHDDEEQEQDDEGNNYQEVESGGHYSKSNPQMRNNNNNTAAAIMLRKNPLPDVSIPASVYHQPQTQQQPQFSQTQQQTQFSQQQPQLSQTQQTQQPQKLPSQLIRSSTQSQSQSLSPSHQQSIFNDLSASNTSNISIQPNQPNNASALQALFDSSGQEILRGMVENELKKSLDQLKTQRTELINQTDFINTINQKLRGFEDNLQQFIVREQRLKDAVDQNNVRLKAVQTNIDTVQSNNGGAVLTEKDMHSFVTHFFNEQIGVMKKEIQTDFSGVYEKIYQLGGSVNTSTPITSSTSSNDFKILEQNVRLLETKFQNSLQSLFESNRWVTGKTVFDIAVHEKPDLQTTVINRLEAGTKVMLLYPILEENDNRWMKVRLVNKDSAELQEGWIGLVIGEQLNVNEFSLF